MIDCFKKIKSDFMRKGKFFTIRFINTFDPVVPLFPEVLPLLEKKGWDTTVMMSTGSYRSSSNTNSHFFKDRTHDEYIWTPKFLRGYKRFCAFFFIFIAPIKIFYAPKTIHVFLTQPPLFFILGSLLSRIIKVPYIIHIMDLYPEFLTKTGMIHDNSLIYIILKKAALHSMLKSQGIIVIGRCMRKILLDQGVPANNITVIQNWASNHITPITNNQNKFIDTYNLQNKFVIMYSGNMGIAHNFSTILNVAKQLKNFEEIIFIFIGRGKKRVIIENYVSSQMDNLLLLDYQEASMLPYSLSAASLHFVSLKKGFEGLIVPSKFYGILASGRPVIFEGCHSSEIALTIKESRCGIVTSCYDIDGLREAIIKYFNDKSRCTIEGNNARKAYDAHYSSQIGSKKYAKTLLRLIP